MSRPTTEKRSHMFDGSRDRAVWRPGDGAGDSDKDLIRSGLTSKEGHATWKIFARDLTNGVQLTDDQPPLRVYLDDKACYEVITSGVFSGNALGRNWPFDYTIHGRIRGTRPNRGRPAYLDDGVTIASSYKQAGAYRFFGSGTNSKKSKEKPGQTEDGLAGSSTSAEQSKQEAHLGQKAAEISQTNNSKRGGNDVKHSNVDANTTVEELHRQVAELQADLRTKVHECNTLTEGRDETKATLEATNSRLETMHRKNFELNTMLKRQKQDGMVVRRMLERIKQERQHLLTANEAMDLRVNSHGNGEKLRLEEEHGVLLELCKILYVGHLSAKSNIDDVRLESFDGLPENLQALDRTHEVVDDGIKAIREAYDAQGHGDILRKLETDVSLLAELDPELLSDDSRMLKG